MPRQLILALTISLAVFTAVGLWAVGSQLSPTDAEALVQPTATVVEPDAVRALVQDREQQYRQRLEEASARLQQQSTQLQALQAELDRLQAQPAAGAAAEPGSVGQSGQEQPRVRHDDEDEDDEDDDDEDDHDDDDDDDDHHERERRRR